MGTLLDEGTFELCRRGFLGLEARKQARKVTDATSSYEREDGTWITLVRFVWVVLMLLIFWSFLIWTVIQQRSGALQLSQNLIPDEMYDQVMDACNQDKWYNAD